MASIFGYSSTPEPVYKVLKKAAEYEIRQYDAQLRAIVSNPEGQVNNSFRKLAGYIFGGNTAKGQTSAEKIAMTAPVAMSMPPEGASSDTIAMTAPVSMQGTTMAFIMPDKYKSVDDLPVPKNTEVKLITVPAVQYAVIRFSGSATSNRPWARKHEEQLRAAAARDSIKLSSNPGDVQLWGYNPPWTLPMFKRNEVAIPLLEPFKAAEEQTEAKTTVGAATS